MLYFVYILTTRQNHTFIKSRSLQKVRWKSYIYEKHVLNSEQRLIKIYSHCLPIGFALYVLSRRLAILCISSNRGKNLCESRLRIYYINVFFRLGSNYIEYCVLQPSGCGLSFGHRMLTLGCRTPSQYLGQTICLLYGVL